MAADSVKLPAFSLQEICQNIMVLIENTTDENDISAFVEHFKTIQASDPDKRLSSDQGFREHLKDLLISQTETSHYERVVQIAINCSKKGVTSLNLPILLLSDIFDCTTLDICEELFSFVEKHVSTWTEEPFCTGVISNALLRMCNDLLRRLSTSQNTIFCGRIQLILTRLFKLSEKSALNLISNFNVENVTVYEYKGKADQDKSDIKEKQSEIVDYILYTKFWALQDFFRLPTQCYEELKWKRFVDNASAILSAFASHKIEHVSKKRKHSATKDVVMSDGLPEQSTYFAKFLTSEKLLNLQLNDSNFRRTILVQFLILFQYLTGDVKFKNSAQVLKEKQSTFIKETTAKVYELLKETPLDGERFAKYVECVLTREENWIAWKNEGCLSFIKEKEKSKGTSGKTAKKSAKRDIAAAISSGSKLDMGSPELTRLWNLCPDNMTACRKDRMFLPDLKEYFEDAIDQADPAAQIEEQYKLVNDPKFGWRALRLLSRRSQHFFQPSSNPFKTLPQYLDAAVKQLAPEILPSQPEEEIIENGTDPKIKEEPEQSGTTEQ